MKSVPCRVLLIYQDHNDSQQMRLTHKRHLNTLEASETEHTITYYNAADRAPDRYFQNAPSDPPDVIKQNTFDVVILHNMLLGYRTAGPFFYEWKKQLDWIRDLDCLKIAVPQDEYDCSGILDEWLFDWNISVVMTLTLVDLEKLYPIMHDKAVFYECLPGYIDDSDVASYNNKTSPLCDREFDLVYRARTLAYYFGSQGQLKYNLPDRILPYARKHDLACDFSTNIEDTKLGYSWFDFLASSKATFGCEGGSSAINYRDEIRATEQFMRNENPDLSFEEFRKIQYADWDSYRFFSVSPRNFDAALTRTGQILIEGKYNGILEPDRYYIPLKRDFSNLDEALEKIKDTAYLQKMVDVTYEDIVMSGNYSYRVFAGLIEKAIEENI
ncbi:hypothetical protein ACFL47_01305 [Candidatus Latescibacterota bacterium]